MPTDHQSLTSVVLLYTSNDNLTLPISVG